MNLKKVNNVFGISLYLIGILKVLLIFLIMIESGNAATAMVTGNSSVPEFSFKSFSKILGYAQITLAACSLIMIFVNIKSYKETIIGYVIGILAVVLECILPPIIFFVYVFVECALYIKAGNVIRNKKLKLFGIDDDSNEKVESTDWFYGDKK